MTWYFYDLPDGGNGIHQFKASVSAESGYIASIDADDFDQATLQFSQWLNENKVSLANGYLVINGDA